MTPVYFIVEGEVLVYRNKNSKQFGETLNHKKSFGEVEYFLESKNRMLLAKAMGKNVTCYTLSYEVCSKYFPKMIDKEVEDLKERTFKLHDRLVFKMLQNEYGSELRNRPDLRKELVRPETWDKLVSNQAEAQDNNIPRSIELKATSNGDGVFETGSKHQA